MSRVHDALRRARASTPAPGTRQAAQADTVLAALGHKPRHRPTLAIVAAAAVALVAIAAIAWFLIRAWGPAPVLRRSAVVAPQPPVSAPTSVAPKQPVSVPAVGAPSPPVKARATAASTSTPGPQTAVAPMRKP